jgi:hypothetical protein
MNASTSAGWKRTQEVLPAPSFRAGSLGSDPWGLLWSRTQLSLTFNISATWAVSNSFRPKLFWSRLDSIFSVIFLGIPIRLASRLSAGEPRFDARHELVAGSEYWVMAIRAGIRFRDTGLDAEACASLPV